MSIILIIVLTFAALIGLLLFIAAISKKDYRLYRETIIDVPKQKVFDYIRFLKNQDYYNKWVMTDPKMKKDFKGVDGNVGFIYGWNGNKKAGEGEQEITTIKEGEMVVSDVRFVRPFAGVSTLQMDVKAVTDGQTKIGWSTSSRMPYPMNIMIPLVTGMLGKDMDISLTNLKTILEK